MTLSKEELEALRGGAFAEDLEIDMATMSLWTEVRLLNVVMIDR